MEPESRRRQSGAIHPEPPRQSAADFRGPAGDGAARPAESVPRARLCLHDLCQEQARRAPDATAIVCGRRRVTYRLLAAAARRLATQLRERGVRPGDRVGLCCDRSAELVVGMLAAMRAGAAYVPLNAEHPTERIRHALDDSTPGVVLAQRKWAPIVSAASSHSTSAVLCCELDTNLSAADLDEPATAAEAGDRDVDPDSPAYILYTSGSTGRPKGVAISHRAAANTILDVNSRFGVGPGDSVLALSSPCFDLSVYDIFGLLAAGGAVVMPDADQVREPAHWAESIRGERITLWNTVPALLEMLVAHAERQASNRLPSLRRVLLSGDWIPVALPDRVRALAPAAKVISLGGATECAIWSIYYPIEATPADWKRIPYGRALANQTVQVLDDDLRRTEVGELGQIHIGGAGVALGYWNRPELTAERFIPDPFSSAPGARLYRTGDLGYYRSDGDIELVGRSDTQVKIRGHRIELGEIEAVLARLPAVVQAAVIARRLATGAQTLRAFIVPRAGAHCRDAELVEQLRRSLPAYMLPNQFVRLEKLPLNVNGKVDRRALESGEYSADPREPYLAPRTDDERRLQALWQSVLGVEPIGARDDFFDLGGDSLLAVTLLARAGATFGARLSAGVLLERPTIERLAELLRGGAAAAAPSRPLVVLQQGVLQQGVPQQGVPQLESGASPLFCIPCAYGSLWEFRKLAARLSPDLSVLGLQPPGLDGLEPPFSRIDQFVDRYLAAIRAAQPTGPYSLVGFSFGGAVAYEIAQRLQAAGESVALLALLDAPAGGRGTLLRFARRGIERFARALAALRRRPAGAPPQGWGPGFSQSALEDIASLPGRLRVHDASRRALDAYRPRPYLGGLFLFRAAVPPPWPKRLFGDPTRPWRRLVRGGYAERLVPADHFDFFADGPLEILADELRECLASTTRR